MNWRKIKNLIKLALEEDIDRGDITTETTIPQDLKARAFIFVKEK